MSLPAELRLKVYSHLMPGLDQCPSAYLGLRNSCLLIREEFDHEAERVLPYIYDTSPLKFQGLPWHIRHEPSCPETMADISAVEMKPTPFVVNRMARFPKNIISW